MRLGWSALALFACRGEPAVVINEVLSQNHTAWADPDGSDAACPEYDDYVELFNQSDEAVWLPRLVLSDGGDPLRLPEQELPAGGHLLVVADDQPDQGPLHAPFGVSKAGDTLTLRQGSRRLDVVDVPPLAPDVAWARYGDGGPGWRVSTPTPGRANEAPPDDPCFDRIEGDFDDHTVPCISTVTGYHALARERAGLSVAKFDLLAFQDPDRRRAVFLDNRFYTFHDEWYVFRLLNGQPIEGEDEIESYPGRFGTWEEILAWAEGVDLASIYPQTVLWLTPGGRLTSPRYYDLALDWPRAIGVGTLLHAAATADRPEVWGFDLEYGDQITHGELVVYFETLEASLAPAMTADLRWLVRSPDQEALAVQMEQDGLRFADRIMRYDELSPEGTVDVYHEGTVAGQVRVLGPGEPLGTATATDIVVLDAVPDDLPPCAALITSAPQTPLSHVALLARSRGIPNLHVSGLATDPQWDAWSRARVKVAIRAASPDGFDVVPLDRATYEQWRRLQESSPTVLQPVNGASLPWTVDLERAAPADVPGLRAEVGGKAAGLAVLAQSGVVRPEPSLAITVRAYQVQVAAMGFEDVVLAEPAFRGAGDPRTRWLVLEGLDGYEARFGRAGDRTHRESVLTDHPPEEDLGNLIRTGGVRGRFAREAVVTEVRGALRPAIEARFSSLSAAQPLRFRSSSNVEDVEGFVGAGLYESASGSLAVEAHAPGSVERALMAVWGSYWSFEAFEERHAAGLDHAAGDMGVLVHAAFQDELELANGVVVATRTPDDWVTIDVNVQQGALSVTNPPRGCDVRPEIVQVELGPRGEATLTRVQRSSEVPGGDVLGDADLIELGRSVRAVLDTWIQIENAAVAPARARGALTLDLELRQVDGAWPLGAGAGPRVVWKQARSLEPGMSRLPVDVQAVPFPLDVLARARRVDVVTCRSASHTLDVVEGVTDPRRVPDLGHATIPFVAQLTLDGVTTDHTAWTASHPSLDPWALDVVGSEGSLSVDGEWLTVDDGSGPVSEPLLEPCASSTWWAAPDDFLDDLLDAE